MKYSGCIILVFIWLTGAAAMDNNLMKNPGCEDVLSVHGAKGARPYLIPKAGWGFVKSSGSFKYQATAKEAHTGKYSLGCTMVKKNSAGSFELNLCFGGCKNGVKEQPEIKFAPDTVYYVSFWAKASGSFVLYLRYFEWDSNNTTPELKYSSIRDFYPTGDWKKYEWVFTTSPEMKNAVPVIKINNTDLSKGGDTVYFDDVEITPFALKYPGTLPVKIKQVK